MRILVIPTFERSVKKLHQQQKADLGLGCAGYCQ